MSEQSGAKHKREIRKEIEIAAPVEAVWRALTESAELMNWFPLEAAVVPGVGGSIRLSWGRSCEGTAPIHIWEPNKRFGWTEFDSSGRDVSIEWTIAAPGGKTIVCVTQSGFSPGSDWDQEYYDSTNYGWVFMLVNLLEYLEHHAGEQRRVAWSRVTVEMTREAIYEKLIAPAGIFIDGFPAALAKGDAYSLHTSSGESWTGRVAFVERPRGFCVTIESLNRALAWLTIEGAGAKPDAQLWFSTYGLSRQKVSQLEDEWVSQLKRIVS